jgi:hypothetical protein
MRRGKVTRIGRAKLCSGCGFAKAVQGSHYCAECRPIVKRVQRIVKRVLGRAGPIPPEAKCVDCGRGAQVRDHRHYAKPLVVEYVCRTCNILRGPALDIEYMVAKEKLVMEARYPVDNLVKAKLRRTMPTSIGINPKAVHVTK